MFITLSFRKYAEVIREAENLDPQTSDDEIAVRLDHYSSRIWQHMNEFGIRMIGLSEKTAAVAAFQVSIAGVGVDWQTGAFDWQKLREGLEFLKPIAVTLTCDDMEQICDGPVGTAMMDRWDEYAHTLERIVPSQIESAVEQACLKYAWQPRQLHEWESQTGMPELDAELRYEQDTAQLARAGLRNPLEKFEADKARREAEETAYQDAERARINSWWEQNG